MTEPIEDGDDDLAQYAEDWLRGTIGCLTMTQSSEPKSGDLVIRGSVNAARDVAGQLLAAMIKQAPAWQWHQDDMGITVDITPEDMRLIALRLRGQVLSVTDSAAQSAAAYRITEVFFNAFTEMKTNDKHSIEVSAKVDLQARDPLISVTFFGAVPLRTKPPSPPSTISAHSINL